MSRNITDASLVFATALPAAAASVVSESVDLGSADAAVAEVIDIQVDLPILPALIDTKTCTLTVVDSADGVTFAAIPGNTTIVATGTETPGSAAALTRTYKLQSPRRYIAVQADVLTGGGDNTGVSYTWQILT